MLVNAGAITLETRFKTTPSCNNGNQQKLFRTFGKKKAVMLGPVIGPYWRSAFWTVWINGIATQAIRTSAVRGTDFMDSEM